jgi:hypothetical protein
MVVAQLMYFPGRTKENHEQLFRIAGVPAKIQIQARALLLHQHA